MKLGVVFDGEPGVGWRLNFADSYSALRLACLVARESLSHRLRIGCLELQSLQFR